MSFNWVEYLTLAEDIAGIAAAPVSQEARARCAISRAYYAAHHVALQTALIKDGYLRPPPGTGNMHEDLVRHFQNSGNNQRKDIGDDLDTLRRLRGRADYENASSAHIINNTLMTLQMANHLLAKLAAL